MVGASIVRKSKAAHETGHTSTVSFIEYATVHYYFHCRRDSHNTENIPPCIKKNPTTVKIFSEQELQNPIQAMSYILSKERQDSQPLC